MLSTRPPTRGGCEKSGTGTARHPSNTDKPSKALGARPIFSHSRTDPRAAIRRDSSRLARREVGNRSFWRSIGVLGMVGWPIAVGSVGGVLFGRYLDMRLATGSRCTLMFMTAGLMLGCFAAWKTVTQKHA